MNIHETEDVIIKYSNKDTKYLAEIVEVINAKKEELFNFFKINKLKGKVNVVIWESVESYKNNILPYLEKSNKEYEEWMIGDTYDGNINMMTIDAVKTTKNREDYNLEEFLNVVCHELVHICHKESKIKEIKGWLWETLATNLGETGGSYNIVEIDCELDELVNNFNKVRNNYPIACTFGKYLFNRFSADEVYNLFVDVNDNEINELFEEAKRWSKSKVESIK